MRSFTEKELNPYGQRPKFKNKNEEIQWIKLMIDICSNHPSQQLQIYAASLIFKLDTLQKV